MEQKQETKKENNGDKKRKDFKKRGKNAFDTQGGTDLEHVTLSIRRVARVMPGGRIFSFAATIAVGDRNGNIGCGTGKSKDTASAIAKAIVKAKKNMVRINITESKGIAHEVDAKYCASRVLLTPSVGLICGGAVRKVLDLAGVENANGKILSRSKNHTNNARVTIKALQKLSI